MEYIHHIMTFLQKNIEENMKIFIIAHLYQQKNK